MNWYPAYLRDIVKQAKRDGCEIHRAGSGHIRIERDGHLLVTASFSPRNPTNARRQVAKHYAAAIAA